jgi:hypothetical protein
MSILFCAEGKNEAAPCLHGGCEGRERGELLVCYGSPLKGGLMVGGAGGVDGNAEKDDRDR